MMSSSSSLRQLAAGGRVARALPAHARGLSIDAHSLKGKHLNNFFLLNRNEFRALLDISHGLKKRLSETPGGYRPLVSRGPGLAGKRGARTRARAPTPSTPFLPVPSSISRSAGAWP